MKELAPIVLFVYNRPLHTQQTLEALAINELANESVLYIFADGPKENANETDKDKIAETRKVLRKANWCKEVYIVEREKNMGLAESVIAGVTEIINKHGEIIVLEVDLITSKGFIKFMNEALNLYKLEEKVFHISGYMFPVNGRLPKTFFYKQTTCWGWATWANRWQEFEKSASVLQKKMNQTGKISYADIDGTNQFIEQLTANIDGRLKTWAVFWHFSVFLKDGLCLHPYRSLVRNIGLDNIGTNCLVSNQFNLNVDVVEYVELKKIPIEENKKVYSYLKNFYNRTSKYGLVQETKNRMKELLPSKLKDSIKRFLNREFRVAELEKARLQLIPRYTEAEVLFLNRKIRIVDIASFQFIQKEKCSRFQI